MCFVFDPHSRGKDGLLHPDGSAVLASFPCIRGALLFLEKLLTQSLRLSMLTQFELVPLYILRTQPIRPLNTERECKSIPSQADELASHTSTGLNTNDISDKNEHELSKNSIETYFEDQYKRDKAHKERHRSLKTAIDTSKRNEYMKNYMRSVRQKHRFKKRQTILAKQRIKDILATDEGRIKQKDWSAKAMKRIRSTPEGQAKSRESGCKSMKKIRNSAEGITRSREITKKCMKKALSTNDGKMRHNKSSIKTMKQLRKRKGYCTKEAIQRKKRKTDESFTDAVNKFNDSISGSCSYVCTCCQQLWFKQSVKDVSTLLASTSFDTNLLKRCKTDFISEEGIEWICSTCICNIKQGKMPKLSVINGMEFPEKPAELNLNNLEERLISLRIPFMQIRSLNSGGQFSLKGSVVNVPADIEPTIRALPRMFHDSETIPVKLKRMKDFKHAVQTENIRPVVVMTALKFLLTNSEMYKEANIKIDDEWNASTINKSTHTFSTLDHDEDSDAFSEEESDDKMPVVTFLDEQTYDKNQVSSVAPGEGQRPLSMFTDPDSEYLAFPSIFCGAKRKETSERIVAVHYSDICKWELRSVDRRVALNVPNIFY